MIIFFYSFKYTFEGPENSFFHWFAWLTYFTLGSFTNSQEKYRLQELGISFFQQNGEFQVEI